MRTVLGFTLALLALAGCAQPPTNTPYEDRVGDEVASLTPQQVAELRAGAGMGYALPAELNGYPGPRHVLEMAGDLGLTPRQRADVEALRARMLAAAIPAGERLIEAHKALDQVFAQGAATNASVRAAVQAVAQAESEVRAIHLEAHIATLAVLDAAQNERYQDLRGYGKGHAGDGNSHQGH